MASAPAESRDETPDPIDLSEHSEREAITFVSPESYPANDALWGGTFPLTYRAGEWYI